MKSRIFLSNLPSRYERVSFGSYSEMLFLRDSVLKFSGSSAFLDFVDMGVKLKRITILYDHFKRCYILLIPKKSNFLAFDFFHKIISEKMNESTLFPLHHIYIFNAF